MPITDLDTLLPLVRDVVAAQPELAATYVFGSVARGTARDDSDLDLGVVYRERGPDAARHDRIATALAAAVSRATGFECVDVVDLATQGPIFAHRVLCDGRLVHEADRVRRIDFESDTMSHAFDFMPTHRIATAGKPQALRHWLRDRYGV